MIKTKNDLRDFLIRDAIANGEMGGGNVVH